MTEEPTRNTDTRLARLMRAAAAEAAPDTLDLWPGILARLRGNHYRRRAPGALTLAAALGIVILALAVLAVVLWPARDDQIHTAQLGHNLTPTVSPMQIAAAPAVDAPLTDTQRNLQADPLNPAFELIYDPLLDLVYPRPVGWSGYVSPELQRPDIGMQSTLYFADIDDLGSVNPAFDPSSLPEHGPYIVVTRLNRQSGGDETLEAVRQDIAIDDPRHVHWANATDIGPWIVFTLAIPADYPLTIEEAAAQLLDPMRQAARFPIEESLAQDETLNIRFDADHSAYLLHFPAATSAKVQFEIKVVGDADPGAVRGTFTFYDEEHTLTTFEATWVSELTVQTARRPVGRTSMAEIAIFAPDDFRFAANGYTTLSITLRGSVAATADPTPLPANAQAQFETQATDQINVPEYEYGYWAALDATYARPVGWTAFQDDRLQDSARGISSVVYFADARDAGPLDFATLPQYGPYLVVLRAQDVDGSDVRQAAADSILGSLVDRPPSSVSDFTFGMSRTGEASGNTFVLWLAMPEWYIGTINDAAEQLLYPTLESLTQPIEVPLTPNALDPVPLQFHMSRPGYRLSFPAEVGEAYTLTVVVRKPADTSTAPGTYVLSTVSSELGRLNAQDATSLRVESVVRDIDSDGNASVMILTDYAFASLQNTTLSVSVEKEIRYSRREFVTTLGDPAAPLHALVFMDLTCVHCRAYYTEVLRPLIVEDVAEGRISLELRWMALDGRAGSDTTAYAALCAAQYDQLLPALDAIIDLNTPISGIAGVLDLDHDTLTSCLANPDLRDALEANRTFANDLGVTGVPTILFRTDANEDWQLADERPDLVGIRALIAAAME